MPHTVGRVVSDTVQEAGLEGATRGRATVTVTQVGTGLPVSSTLNGFLLVFQFLSLSDTSCVTSCLHLNSL